MSIRLLIATKKEDNGTKWNVSAGVFYPAREKEETEKNEGGKEGEQMKLYPQSELMVYTVTD